MVKLEICILAGGLSSRFGRDKSTVRFGRRTMLSIVRHAAAEVGPVRVVRRDRVPRCGPLGGVVTALQTTRASAVLFLACDMPLVTAALMRSVIKRSRRGSTAVFAEQGGRVGFPCLVPRDRLDSVQAQIAAGVFSIHQLASVLRARTLVVPVESPVLLNVNTREDAARAAEFLLSR